MFISLKELSFFFFPFRCSITSSITFFSTMSQVARNLGFVIHIISAGTTQTYLKTVMISEGISGHGCVPLHTQGQVTGTQGGF